jgi:hypothetical protein
VEIQNVDNMDVFINILDKDKFQATNNTWNLLGLNSPQNVGMVSELINQRPFANKEEWEEYYYVNGRSKEYLVEVGQKLYNAVKSDLNISLEECIECVRFRVICETWNGIIIREMNTIKQLTLIYDNKFTYKKTTDIDFEFAVDYEMYYKDKLICGLQIKPTSYLTSDFEYIRRAHRCNDEKNLKYQQKFGVPVITITSEMSGIPTSHLEMLKLNKFDRELL